ncbi:MAG: transposase [Phycisphaerae bacterium]
MPRVARVVIPGCPHHVTQRGNNRQDVFFTDDDRRAYLEILREQCERFGLGVQAYCLMTNHIHLVATPATGESLAKAVGRTNWRYAQHVNRWHARSGHLWQNRFYSCPLDEQHFWTAVTYVERNPVRAGVVRVAWEYAWSSAGAHVGGSDRSGLLDIAQWREWLPRAGDWREALGRPGEAGRVEQLRGATIAGRPLGSDDFIAKLETAIGRRLRRLPVGRPKRRN